VLDRSLSPAAGVGVAAVPAAGGSGAAAGAADDDGDDGHSAACHVILFVEILHECLRQKECHGQILEGMGINCWCLCCSVCVDGMNQSCHIDLNETHNKLSVCKRLLYYEPEAHAPCFARH
jgi:hypothetical protein